MSVLRAVLHYGILVGLPFLGVLAVMNIGTNITPPASIQGKWVLDANLAANRQTECSNRLSRFVENSLTIAQSGVFLEVSLPNPPKDILAGRLDEMTFLAEAPPPLFGDDIFGLLRITGTLAIEGQTRVMRGVIAMPRRVDCVPVPFVAKLSSDMGKEQE